MQNAHLRFIFLFIFFAPNLTAQPFEKDASFGENGEMVFSKGRGMLVTADDKIVLIEQEENDIRLERMHKDGAYDLTFGTEGRTVVNFEEQLYISKLISQSDEKILLFGRQEDSLNQLQVVVIRLEKNGLVDTSFGDGGVIISDFVDFNIRINNIAVQEDGKLIVVGENYFPPVLGTVRTSDCLMLRFNTNGSLDETFGNKGIVLMDFNNREGDFSEVSVLKDGKIIAAGDFENQLREQDIGLAKFTSEGKLDTTFGDGGKVALNINLADDFLGYMTILENDEILIGGSANNRVKEDILLVQMRSNGQLDTTFGEGGITLTDLSGFSSPALQSSERPTSFLRRPNGQILIFGNTHTRKDIIDYKAFFVQYTAGGHIDQDFGNEGQLIIEDFNSLTLYGLGNQSSGKIIATGRRIPDSESINFITRYLPDLTVGTIDFTNVFNNAIIYPNPIQEKATLKYTLETTETLTIQLTDLNGRIIKTYVQNQYQKAGEYQQVINLPNNLTKGFYLVKLSTGNGQFVVKVVK